MSCVARKRKPDGGFTIIEAVVVLLLLGILAAVATVKFSKTNASAVAEAEALKAALRYAQVRAMADIYTWGISIGGNSYTLVEDNPNVNGAVLPGGTGATRTLPSGVSITTGAGTTIRFDWRGEPVSNQITDPATQSPVQVTTPQTIMVTQSAGVNVTITPYTGFIP